MGVPVEGSSAVEELEEEGSDGVAVGSSGRGDCVGHFVPVFMSYSQHMCKFRPEQVYQSEVGCR